LVAFVFEYLIFIVKHHLMSTHQTFGVLLTAFSNFTA
jgi:hypothetical protein